MASRADIYAGPFCGILAWCAALQPRRYTNGDSPKNLRKPVAPAHAGGRLGAVDRIGEHLQAMMESLKTWAELGISADFPREQ